MEERGKSFLSILQRIGGFCSGHCGLGFSSDGLASLAVTHEMHIQELGPGWWLAVRWRDLESYAWWRLVGEGGQVVGMDEQVR